MLLVFSVFSMNFPSKTSVRRTRSSVLGPQRYALFLYLQIFFKLFLPLFSNFFNTRIPINLSTTNCIKNKFRRKRTCRSVFPRTEFFYRINFFLWKICRVFEFVVVISHAAQAQRNSAGRLIRSSHLHRKNTENTRKRKIILLCLTLPKR